MPKPPRRPRWYFSLRSPYSWLAYVDLSARSPQILDEIDWVPFYEPDARTIAILQEDGTVLPLAQMPRAKNFYILADVRRLTRERGIADVTWPVDKEPVWEVSHLAYLIAADSGAGPEFVRRVYEARWKLGQDISDPAVMAGIGERLGLPPGDLAAAADDDGLRRRGAALLAESARDGLFGVPFFVAGREKFWGMERIGAFAAALTGEPDPDAIPAEDAALYSQWLPALADGGHAGGCG